MRIKDTEQRIVTFVAYLILTFMTVVCLLPFIRLLAVSLSGESYVQAGQVYLWPKGFTLSAIKFIFNNNAFHDAFIVTVFATIAFSFIALVFTVATAYPLSRKYLRGARFFSLMIVFTLLFNGGIVPTYLVVKLLGLLNSFWAMIIPNMISAFNVIIFISFFRAIPDDYEESAKLDGASNLRVLIHIMLPLSKPILATITLFYAVFRWNSWFDVLVYINDPKLFTLQIVLKNLVDSSSNSIMKSFVAHDQALLSVQGAAVLFTITPIILVYPYLQKYFIKGVHIGGIKG